MKCKTGSKAGESMFSLLTATSFQGRIEVFMWFKLYLKCNNAPQMHSSEEICIKRRIYHSLGC